MVIKSKIYEYLKTYLDEYLYGFQKDQLDVALLSGNINLTNVNFKPTKVNNLFESIGLPFRLKAGLIGKLSFKFHYTAWTSKPLELELDELLLVLGPIMNAPMPAENPLHASPGADRELPRNLFRMPAAAPPPLSSDEEDNCGPELRDHNIPTGGSTRPPKAQKSYSKMSTGSEADFNEPAPQEAPKGVLENYFSTLLKNLTLRVNRVCIKYEDEIYPFEHPFSLGICLEKLEIKSSPEEWRFSEDGVRRHKPPAQSTVKECAVSNAYMYVISMSSMLVPTSLWEDTLHSNIGIFEAIAAYEIRELILEEAEAVKQDGNNLLLHPLNAAFCFTFNEDAPKLTVSGNVEQLRLRISSNSAEVFRNFQDYFSNSQLWWFIRRYRPKCSVPLKTDCRRSRQRKNRKIIIKQWFRYTLKFIRIKKQLMEYVKQKKTQLQEQDRQRERRKMKAARPNTGAKENTRPVAPAKKPAFLVSPRRIPGKSSLSLNTMVKSFNKESCITKKKPTVDTHFPVFLRDSEITIKIDSGIIEFFDSDAAVSLLFTLKGLFVNITTLTDELTVNSSVTQLIGGLKDNDRTCEVLRIGCPQQMTMQPVSAGLFKSLQRPTVTRAKEVAATLKFSYRPGELKSVPHESTLQMYSIHLELSPLHIKFSSSLLSSALVLYESLKLDRSFKNNMDLRHIGFLSTTTESHLKHKRRVRHSSLLNYAIDSAGTWFTELEQWLRLQDSKLKRVDFDCRVNCKGAQLEVAEGSLTVPAGALGVSKTDGDLLLHSWGLEIRTKDSLHSLLARCSLLNRLVVDRIEYFRKVLSSFRSL